jgi:hypothetical protein
MDFFVGAHPVGEGCFLWEPTPVGDGLFVGAHPCGRWAWHTPCKPSPKGDGSYKDKNMGHSNFIGLDY